MALATAANTIATPLRVANSRRPQTNARRAPVRAMADSNRRAVSFGVLATGERPTPCDQAGSTLSL